MNLVEKLELEIERKKHKEEIKKLQEKILRLETENLVYKNLYNKGIL